MDNVFENRKSAIDIDEVLQSQGSMINQKVKEIEMSRNQNKMLSKYVEFIQDAVIKDKLKIKTEKDFLSSVAEIK